MTHEQIVDAPKTSVVELEILNLVTDPNIRGAIAELQSYLKDYALLVTDLCERMAKVEKQAADIEKRMTWREMVG